MTEPATAFNRYDELIKAFTENSKDMNQLALLVLGGSLLVILSTDYLKPATRKVRLMYLLFIPAWVCLALSIYYSNIVVRKNAAYFHTHKAETKELTCSSMNDVYGRQIDYFQYAILILAAWLVCYLLWWIFQSDKPKKEENKTDEQKNEVTT